MSINAAITYVPSYAYDRYRLSVTALPYLAEADHPFVLQRDPFADRAPLPEPSVRLQTRGGEVVPEPTRRPTPAGTGQVSAGRSSAGAVGDLDPLRTAAAHAEQSDAGDPNGIRPHRHHGRAA